MLYRLLSASNVSSVKPLHPLNASSPISVTAAGIVIYVNARQFLNAPSPNFIIEAGIFILLRFSQPAKAFAPIVVILLHIWSVTFDKSVLFIKAFSPISVTFIPPICLGIIIDVMLESIKPVILRALGLTP